MLPEHSPWLLLAQLRLKRLMWPQAGHTAVMRYCDTVYVVTWVPQRQLYCARMGHGSGPVVSWKRRLRDVVPDMAAAAVEKG